MRPSTQVLLLTPLPPVSFFSSQLSLDDEPVRRMSLKERRDSEKSLTPRAPQGSALPTGGAAPGPVACCPGGHGLKQYTTPNDSMTCGQCNSGMAKGAPFFGCKACKATLCGKCFRAPPASGPFASQVSAATSPSFFGASFEESAPAAAAVANCPGAHGLKNYNAPNDSIACDRCSRGLKKGEPFHGCKACKFRICPTCFKAG